MIVDHSLLKIQTKWRFGRALGAIWTLGRGWRRKTGLRRYFFCGSYMFLFCLVFAMSLCASVYMSFVVTCWERADLLALVCGVYCEFVTFPLVSWVRCGTWLYRFLIFAPLLTLSPPVKYFTDRSKAVILMWNIHVISAWWLLCFRVRLFIDTLWSPAVKGLSSWLSFVMSNCEFVTFPLVSWVRCGTWLYRFLIFAPLLTLSPPVKYFTDRSKAVILMWNIHVISAWWLLCFRARLFIDALWSPAGKGLSSWFSFVMSNCEFVTFPLVSWIRCCTWLYRCLIFALFLSLNWGSHLHVSHSCGVMTVKDS